MPYAIPEHVYVHVYVLENVHGDQYRYTCPIAILQYTCMAIHAILTSLYPGYRYNIDVPVPIPVHV